MSHSIPIGILHSQQGPMAVDERPLIEAALLAVEQINTRGGILGHEVRPLVAEGISNDDDFAREAERLLLDEGVCSLFGCWTSSARKAVKTVVEREESLLWYPVQYEGLEESRHIVYTGACMNQQIAPAIDWALSSGRERIALVGSDYIFPRTANKLVCSMVASSEACIVHESYFPLDCRDFNALLPSLRASEPDLIINTINGVGNISFLEQLQAIPSLARPDLVCSLSCTENLFSKLSKGAEGQLACWSYFESIDTHANREFLGALTCPPKTGPHRMLVVWAMKEAGYGHQTTHPRTDHLQAQRSRRCFGSRSASC